MTDQNEDFKEEVTEFLEDIEDKEAAICMLKEASSYILIGFRGTDDFMLGWDVKKCGTFRALGALTVAQTDLLKDADND